VAVSVSLSGLLPGQAYHYRLVAKNAVGTSFGQDATFETTAPPQAVTGSGTATTVTSETLAGDIDPGGLDTTYWFEWGPTGSFGHRSQVENAGAGNSQISVSDIAGRLRPETTYVFRLVARNSLGISLGTTETFQTAESSCVAEDKVVSEDAVSLQSANDALSSDRLSDGSSVASDEESLSTDEQSLAAANGALSADEARAANSATTFTALPATGEVLHRGSVVYKLDGEPVPLFYGTTIPDRALYLGVSDGEDVAELQQNLVALGFGAGISPSTHFSAATEEAVKAWQGSLGLPETGVVDLGDFVLEPGPIQVDTVTASLGEAVQAGATVLTATSTTRVVTISLDAAEQSEVKVGDPVEITLPDNDTTPGVVSSVGTVATTSSSGAGNTGGGSSATVSVLVTPTDPAATGDYDQAPVEVAITNASVNDALVVPVDALLALAGGGYALEEIGPGKLHHLVAVNLGLFDDADGLVQVSGPGVAAGERVVVPGL
jgi:peptidoglycan hydrolase-like protein with peptidoglycan-binding domain